MPRFLQRILGENLFRKEPAMRDELQKTRRVLVRTSTSFPEEQTHWRASLFDLSPDSYTGTGLKDGASITGSAERPILAPSLQEQAPFIAKQHRTRRRLSKKHRKPA
ncbi:hypothetical protein ACN47E_000742 [Coniothyrium glycines]